VCPARSHLLMLLSEPPLPPAASPPFCLLKSDCYRLNLLFFHVWPQSPAAVFPRRKQGAAA
jgi:hypothetical protein